MQKIDAGWYRTSGSFEKMKYIAPAVMLIFAGLAAGGMLLFMANGRKIMAFQTQATMPIMKEDMQEMAPAMGQAMETMAPAMGKVAGEMAKTVMPVQKEIMQEMGPSMGAYYGEIAKGVKQGFSSADPSGNKKPCPHCGMKIDEDSVFCEVCGKKL